MLIRYRKGIWKKEAVKTILDYNPDVNRTEAHGGTTMHWAARFDDAENTGWLIDRGAKIDHVYQYGRTPYRGLPLQDGSGINFFLDKAFAWDYLIQCR